MKASDVATLDGVETVQPDYENRDILAGYASDLLSDVMAHAPEGCLLITIQAHGNTVSVASLAGAAGVMICNRRPIPDDMIAAARAERLPLFRTARNQFEMSCLLGGLLSARE